MNTKTLIGFIVVIAILGLAFFFINRSPNGNPLTPPPPPPPKPPSVTDANWKLLLSHAAGPPKGNPNAPWTLIECGDFECPNCGKAKPLLEQFVDQNPDKVKLYFVNYPLTRIHKHAEEAAEASLAASAQGKFWPMYDMLYGDQDALIASEIEYHASSIPGLDVKKFTQDMESQKYAAQAQESGRVAFSVGIMSTPTFLLRKSTGPEDRAVYAYLGFKLDPKYKFKSLSDLVSNPPWTWKTPPSSQAKVAAQPAAAKP